MYSIPPVLQLLEMYLHKDMRPQVTIVVSRVWQFRYVVIYSVMRIKVMYLKTRHHKGHTL